MKKIKISHWKIAVRLYYLRCESVDKKIVFNKSLQILIRAKCFSVKLFLNKNENNGLVIQSKFNLGFDITREAVLSQTTSDKQIMGKGNIIAILSLHLNLK